MYKIGSGGGKVQLNPLAPLFSDSVMLDMFTRSKSHCVPWRFLQIRVQMRAATCRMKLVPASLCKLGSFLVLVS